MSSITKSSYAVLTRTLAICVQAGLVPMLWGRFGVGKTSVIADLADKLGMTHVEVKLASIMDATDFVGLPFRNEEQRITESSPWDWILRCGEGTLLFIDEITTAPQEVMNALLRVVLEGYVGDYPIKAKIVLAGNPPEMVAAGTDLSDAFRDRLVHLPFSYGVEDYVQGKREGWKVDAPKLPKNWTGKYLKEAEAEHLAFLESHEGEEYFELDPQAGDFCGTSPRAWDKKAVPFMAAARASKTNGEVLRLGLAGCLGTLTASQYLGWLKAQEGGLTVASLFQDMDEVRHLKEMGDDEVGTILDGVASQLGRRHPTPGGGGDVTASDVVAIFTRAIRTGVVDPSVALRSFANVQDNVPPKLRKGVLEAAHEAIEEQGEDGTIEKGEETDGSF